MFDIETLFKKYQLVNVRKEDWSVIGSLHGDVYGPQYRVELRSFTPIRCWGLGNGPSIEEAVQKAEAEFEHNYQALIPRDR